MYIVLINKIRLFFLSAVFSAVVCLCPQVSGASDIPPPYDQAVSEIHQSGDRGRKIQKAVQLMGDTLYRDAERILFDIINSEPAERDKAYFLLGKLYREEKVYEQAEKYMMIAAESYPLLRDYAFNLLIDIYRESEQFEKIIEAASKISSRLLMQKAAKAEIEALFALEKPEEAKAALAGYVINYRKDWEYKFKLAEIYASANETEQAARLYKDIYINAGMHSKDAHKALTSLKADQLTREELFERAENLYANNKYKEAEMVFQYIAGSSDGPEKEAVLFKLGMSQFRQKQYPKAAGSFGLLKTPRSMYWQARAYYRADQMQGFKSTIEELELNYPASKNLPVLLRMEGDELRRKGLISDSEKSYRKILQQFPNDTEDALWGLGWMNYSAGNYDEAFDCFLKLSEYTGSRDYMKYLFWKARTQEKIQEECRWKEAVELCGEEHDFFAGMPSDASYYGYLINMRSGKNNLPLKKIIASPDKPEGAVYDRIEALSLLGLKEEAVSEIRDALKNGKKQSEFLYLGYVAMELEAYKYIIAFAEPRSEEEFLLYSYPLAYWDKVTQAASRSNIDASLISAIIREESRFDRKAVSWAGAIGLMQLMPSTAQGIKKAAAVSLKNSGELEDAGKNIQLGAHYLSRLMNEYKNIPLAIAAYNAGERTLRKWLEKLSSKDVAEFIENIPYGETRSYVKKVLKSYWQYRSINGEPLDGLQ